MAAVTQRLAAVTCCVWDHSAQSASSQLNSLLVAVLFNSFRHAASVVFDAPSAVCLVCSRVSFFAAKRPDREADRAHARTVQVKNGWSFTSTPVIGTP
jgi:hypothetical protein